ncbi:MAG: serine/threonine protein kinase, partial [Verrucomicrobiales bacterium]|nr:serine/threonine protein kinase [Verrucomicrobiales bacterium]
MTTNSIRDDAGGTSCPACGSDVGAGVSGGLCPKCLLRGVAEAPTETAVSGAGERPGVPDRARLAALFPELEIHELVGAGGMGAVFKARQPHLDRWVALKVLPETMAAHAAFVERFHREARTLARLNHPNIVTVFDFGRRDAFCFLLMEFVDGVNLRQALRAGRFSPEQALGLVPKICEALQFAHDEGVLHRDIKPENLLLDGRGRVKIADFGIAKLVGDATGERGLTVSGAALGTPAYMAPEQIENPSDVDHRADIYSLGVVIYEMLTGELPLGRFSAP